jgi:GNAT superfamily N-acetyltransferase
MGQTADHSIVLRAPRPEDAEVIARLLTELGHPTRADDVPSRVTAVLREGGTVLLASDPAGGDLGLMCLAKHAVLHAPGPVAYITALVTTASARRRGVGRVLVEAAKAWAREEGCVRLSVTSAERRADAHAFYPACGMPYTGRRFTVGLEPSS